MAPCNDHYVNVPNTKKCPDEVDNLTRYTARIVPAVRRTFLQTLQALPRAELLYYLHLNAATGPFRGNNSSALKDTRTLYPQKWAMLN